METNGLRYYRVWFRIVYDYFHHKQEDICLGWIINRTIPFIKKLTDLKIVKPFHFQFLKNTTILLCTERF